MQLLSLVQVLWMAVGLSIPHLLPITWDGNVLPFVGGSAMAYYGSGFMNTNSNKMRTSTCS